MTQLPLFDAGNDDDSGAHHSEKSGRFRYRYFPDRANAKFLPHIVRDIAKLVEICCLESYGRQSSEPIYELTSEIHRIAFSVEETVLGLLERLEYRERAAAAHQKRLQQMVHAHERKFTAFTTKLVATDYERLVSTTLERPTAYPRGYWVYILWGECPKKPVYVGKSTNVLARINTHMQDAVKRPLIKRIQLIECTDGPVMDATEMRLIRHYRPQLNKAGNYG